MEKLYCYVDETGQDTKGVLFSVCCTVVVSHNAKEQLERLMKKIEKESKKKTKWQKTDHKVKLKNSYPLRAPALQAVFGA